MPVKTPRGCADESGMAKHYINRMDAVRLINEGIKATYAKDEEGADRRRHRRVKGTGAVTSTLGTILDISAGGMRVVGKKEAEGQGRVELVSATDRVVVRARVVWCHKVGFRKYVMGLEFIDLNEEQVHKMREMATTA